MRAASISPWPATQGLMLVDQWLDHRKAADIKKFVLIVAIQLHAKPVPNAAEAAVALLLGWPPLAKHHGLKVHAWLHRPVAVRSTHWANDMATTLRWGHSAASEIRDVWQTGLDEADKSALLQCAGDIKLDLSTEGANSYAGVHDLHRLLGDTGAAAAWFATALASEHAATTGKPQSVACRNEHVHVAIVRPAA